MRRLQAQMSVLRGKVAGQSVASDFRLAEKDATKAIGQMMTMTTAATQPPAAIAARSLSVCSVLSWA